MKKTNFLLLLAAISFIIALLACGKKIDYPVSSNPRASSTAPVPAPPAPAKNTPPYVDAGLQQFIFLPITQTKFSAYAFDNESPGNLKYEWKKISGSDKSHIDSPNIVQPTLFNLEKGVYEFLVTATDPDSLVDRDRIVITVADATGEFQTPKLEWSCDMGCLLKMDIRILENIPFTLFIKTDKTGINWFEVPSDHSPEASTSKFFYGLNTNSLFVYTDNNLGTAELKMVFK
jgi:hypothetical protein